MHISLNACISDNIEQNKLFLIVSEEKKKLVRNIKISENFLRKFKSIFKCSKKIIVCGKNDYKKSQISFEALSSKYPVSYIDYILII